MKKVERMVGLNLVLAHRAHSEGARWTRAVRLNPTSRLGSGEEEDSHVLLRQVGE